MTALSILCRLVIKMFVLLLMQLPFSFRPFHKYSALDIGKRAAIICEEGRRCESFYIFF